MPVRLVANDPAGDGDVPVPEPIRSGISTAQDDRAVPLPRNLLVSLHALATDIAQAREGHESDRPLCTCLDQALSRLDDLVDSIYDMAATAPAAPARSLVGRSRRRRTSAVHEPEPARS